ncbi:hypothetical protein [Shigella phage ESh1]|nr:hypothetical protein [Shigella phage ESh1]
MRVTVRLSLSGDLCTETAYGCTIDHGWSVL